ncbi:MAG: hypothetical protein AAGD13_13930 [Pseudomonadota bacterium]
MTHWNPEGNERSSVNARSDITIRTMMQEVGIPCDFSLETFFDRIELLEADQ